MVGNYTEYARIFKALSDAKRLQIIDMLSNGELCACKIQEAFDISQPTLSHDMKLLCECGLVIPRKEGKWTHYSLSVEKMNEVYRTVGKLLLPEKYEQILDCDCK
nr:metalloregulator ArsR/SmtB family transcription factor [uncultured Sellimonas sp.]